MMMVVNFMVISYSIIPCYKLWSHEQKNQYESTAEKEKSATVKVALSMSYNRDTNKEIKHFSLRILYYVFLCGNSDS